jgi:hypothetical protein
MGFYRCKISSGFVTEKKGWLMIRDSPFMALVDDWDTPDTPQLEISRDIIPEIFLN